MSNADNSRVAVFPGYRAPDDRVAEEALARAMRRVAPLWPLDNFVAVNPFLGFSDEPFLEAAQRVRAACDAPLLMPRRHYCQALRDGRITDADLKQALESAAAAGDLSVEALRAAAASADPEPAAVFPTVAAAVARLSGTDWETVVTERISHWAAGYFDRRQAGWSSPFAGLPPYVAWRREISLDCSDTVLRLAALQRVVAELPEDPRALCLLALKRLAVPEAQLDLYLHRLLMTIGGWVAHLRYRGWQAELGGAPPAQNMELLAIRLAWELVLLEGFRDAGGELSWRRSLTRASRRPRGTADMSPRCDQLLQHAYEIGWQRCFQRQLKRAAAHASPARPGVQAVFCIDVRSEVFRRALEGVAHDVETLGFAGFFGLPVEYLPLAAERGAAHCPVLLTPAFSVRESAPAGLANRLTRRVRLRRQLRRGWQAFRSSAVSCFVFVESYGLAYAWKLVSHTLGLSRPEAHPAQRGLPPRLARQLGPQLADSEDGAGVGLDRQVDFAESMLRGMSLTENFARLVLLVGHGSATTNNAHGTGYDCGACGGQTGEASARIAAQILNTAAVRDGLRQRGIEVPGDTRFLAALHTTTTDDVELLDTQSLPASHAGDVATLRAALASAGDRASAERAQLLGVAPQRDARRALRRRSRDWSEVRPEWGLAGCAGFVAAPRHLTRALDLEGRCFLHSYDYREDPGFETLELIMTAPMVVATWISLQYYGSTVAPGVFGSGDKTLHNVVGAGIGVLEGNGGDLRVGLPLQALHDGQRFVHEPLRLSVYLAAPIVAITAILERHQHLRDLADNGWLHLFAVYDEGDVLLRYAGDLRWEPVAA
jgi:uncharacterized protein YbcC (UPF0753/DUF2309 family)